MVLQRLLLAVRELARRADQRVRQPEGRNLSGAESRLLIAIRDRLDLGLVQSLGSRTREPDIPSESAIGDPRVTDSRDFLDALTDSALLPEMRVELRKSRSHFGLMGEDGSEIGGPSRNRGGDSSFRRHSDGPQKEKILIELARPRSGPIDFPGLGRNFEHEA
jgi:hypothetical protein